MIFVVVRFVQNTLGDVNCVVIILFDVILVTKVLVEVMFVVRVLEDTILAVVIEAELVILEECMLPTVADPIAREADVNIAKEPVLVTNKLLDVMLCETLTLVEVILVIIPDVETRLFVVQLIKRKLVPVAFVKTILPLVKFKIVPLVEVMVGLLSVPIDAKLDIRDVELMLVLIKLVFITLDSVEVVETNEVVIILVDVS